MKNEKHPLYDLLLSNPSAFLEVKGEWSLSRLTSLLNDKSKIDAKLASEKYRLVKESINAEMLYKGVDSINHNFIGYSSRTKYIEKESPEVAIISDGLYRLIRRIFHDNKCIYSQHTKFSYGKSKHIKLIRPSSIKFMKYDVEHPVEVNTNLFYSFLIFF